MSGSRLPKHLENLRRWRNHDRDLSLGFLEKQVRTEYGRAAKQLGKVVPHWERLVPAALLPHTRLDGLSRGVLRVTVSDASKHYELDRLLRGGLTRELQQAAGGANLRRVKVQVGPIEKDG